MVVHVNTSFASHAVRRDLQSPLGWGKRLGRIPGDAMPNAFSHTNIPFPLTQDSHSSQLGGRARSSDAA